MLFQFTFRLDNFNKYKKHLFDKIKLLATKVFAIAGLDARTIGSKSLIGFSSGLTLIVKRQNISLTIKQKINFGTGVTELEYPAIANTER